MEAKTPTQLYLLILDDIAITAALQAHDPAHAPSPPGDGYQPGGRRDRWMAQTPDPLTQKRVVAMANTLGGALQNMTPEQLVETARTYGIPLEEELAATVARHFADRRGRVLRYRS